MLNSSLQPAPGHPLHRQLEANLREMIRSGQFEAGSRLPGEHELAAQLGVSRHTLRHALGVLATEGLVRRQRGRGGGTLVSRRVNQPVSSADWKAFTPLPGKFRPGVVISVRSSSSARGSPLPVSWPSGWPLTGTPLERIVRLRTADGEPLVLETVYLAATLAVGVEQADLELGSLYDALERLHGIVVVRAGKRSARSPLSGRSPGCWGCGPARLPSRSIGAPLPRRDRSNGRKVSCGATAISIRSIFPGAGLRPHRISEGGEHAGSRITPSSLRRRSPGWKEGGHRARGERNLPNPIVESQPAHSISQVTAGGAHHHPVPKAPTVGAFQVHGEVRSP